MDLAEVAKAAFFGYRDNVTGWAVPKGTEFFVEERGLGLIELRWHLVALGFAKRPTPIGETQQVAWNVDREVTQAHIEHVAYTLAHNCIASYILWCGRKEDARTPIHA